VTDLKTNQRHVVSATPLSLSGGPAVTRWMCAFSNASTHLIATVDEAQQVEGSKYTKIVGLIPADRSNFTHTTEGTLVAWYSFKHLLRLRTQDERGCYPCVCINLQGENN
jgi:hypothetical protein